MGPIKRCVCLFQNKTIINFSASLGCHNPCFFIGSVMAFSSPSFATAPTAPTATTMAVTPNYFDILGVQQSFVQSTSELKSKYKSLMSKFHPDKHRASTSSSSSSDKQEEKISSEQMAIMAADVTRAYSVIEDPLSRSLHLLELGGEPIHESDKSIVDKKIIMKIMLVREEVDDASTDEELRPMLQSCRNEQNKICDELTISFGEERIEDAKKLTAELQYWKRVEETIIDKMKSIE